MKPLSDGWHALPSGGALGVHRGAPFAISDRGLQEPDERVMLREASALLDAELVWKYWPRHERWQRPPLSWRWTLPPVLRLEASSVALVSVAGCGCGRYAGVRWIVDPMDGARVWSCERCAHAVEVHHVTFENADQIDCDGNCQRVPG